MVNLVACLSQVTNIRCSAEKTNSQVTRCAVLKTGEKLKKSVHLIIKSIRVVAKMKVGCDILED